MNNATIDLFRFSIHGKTDITHLQDGYDIQGALGRWI